MGYKVLTARFNRTNGIFKVTVEELPEFVLEADTLRQAEQQLSETVKKLKQAKKLPKLVYLTLIYQWPDFCNA